MRFISFVVEDRASWGIVNGDQVAAIGHLAHAPQTLRRALEAGFDPGAMPAGVPRFALDAITFLPVIPNPSKIICVGLNYEDHRKEAGRAIVAHPTLFARFANSQTGHLQPLIRPQASVEFDYEGELALVIGRPGRHIAAADAFSHVAGYACYNDASVRDWQRHTSQFTPGKNFAATGAFGPCLVTPGEVGQLDGLGIRTRINGLVVQEAELGQLIFEIPEIIAYCSSFTRLEVGDVIVTGTPGGVGMKRDPQLWMAPGDVVEVEIDRIGLLRNPVTAETRDRKDLRPGRDARASAVAANEI